MTNNKKQWKGKTCVVTGGTGFIGTHLCAALYDLGAKVINVDIEPDTKGTTFRSMNSNRNIPSVCVDLSERESIKTVQNLQPEVIFHLAAIPYGPKTSEDPVGAYYNNVNSTFNMLQVGKSLNSDFILASSACYFGAALSSPLKPNDPLCDPEHFYTYTKRLAEDLTNSYNDFYQERCAICRFVNIYGPGDRYSGRIVPSLCLQLIKNKNQTLELYRSNGESVFEFLYVNDAVEALIVAAENMDNSNRLYQFGPGQMARISIAELAKKMSAIYDNSNRSIIFKFQHPEKKVRKFLDISDTKRRLDWESTWSLENGLKDTISWYAAHYRNLNFHK